MKKLSIVLVFIVLLVSCKKDEKPKSIQSPSKNSIEAAKGVSKLWSLNHKGAADLPEKELIEALAEFEDIDLKQNKQFNSMTTPQFQIEMQNDRVFGLTTVQSNRIRPRDLWRTKNHEYGFINAGQKESEIINARDNTPDKTLKGARMKITLDALKIETYPGNGTHDIVFNFYGQTQSGDELTPLSFSLGVSAEDGDVVPAIGKKIFVGLNVGTEGIDLKGNTINVNTRKDKTFFSILAGNIFSQGLKLIDKVQPALQPLTALANGVSKELSEKNKGIVVQTFDIALDFSDIPSRIKIKTGSYIIVQIPPLNARNWHWNEWEYVDGRIQKKSDKSLIPFNYIVIGISRIE